MKTETLIQINNKKFLNAIRVAAFDKELSSKFNYDPIVIEVEKRKNFPAVEKEDKISFARDINDPFNLKKRVSTTVGRYVRRNLKIDVDKLPDTFLNKFLYVYLSALDVPSNKDIKILKGKSITNFYKKTTIKSCMTGDNACQTELYALNPDKINLIVYKDRARALLWKCDKNRSVLDRIYPVGTKDEVQIVNWALNKGYFVSDINPNPDYNDFQDKDYTITVKANKYIPYMDTFMVLRAFKGKRLLKLGVINSDIEYLDIDEQDAIERGFAPWIARMNCDECGGYIFGDEILICDGHYFCESCKDNLVCFCKYCKKEFIFNEYNYDSNYNSEPPFDNKTCLKCSYKLYKKCQNCGDWYKKENLTPKRQISFLYLSDVTNYYCKYCL